MRDRYRKLAFVTLVQYNLEKGKMLIILATWVRGKEKNNKEKNKTKQNKKQRFSSWK